jgi:hypothetical protein
MAREYRFEWYIVDADTGGAVARGGTYLSAEAVNLHGECESVDAEVAGALRAFRKNAPDLEHEAIVDSLTSAQEGLLKNAHAKNYHGTDDDMPDAFEGWLEDLSLDELKSILSFD